MEWQLSDGWWLSLQRTSSGGASARMQTWRWRGGCPLPSRRARSTCSDPSLCHPMPKWNCSYSECMHEIYAFIYICIQLNEYLPIRVFHFGIQCQSQISLLSTWYNICIYVYELNPKTIDPSFHFAIQCQSNGSEEVVRARLDGSGVVERGHAENLRAANLDLLVALLMWHHTVLPLYYRV